MNKANDPDQIFNAIGITITVNRLYELICSKYDSVDGLFIANLLYEKFEKDILEIEEEIWSQ